MPCYMLCISFELFLFDKTLLTVWPSSTNFCLVFSEIFLHRSLPVSDRSVSSHVHQSVLVQTGLPPTLCPLPSAIISNNRTLSIRLQISWIGNTLRDNPLRFPSSGILLEISYSVSCYVSVCTAAGTHKKKETFYGLIFSYFFADIHTFLEQK